ncbi:uncharacterized protein LOC124146396 [Haliotis rufescens]|uniref:uncharacterized protein LOC124146396 n=1 Tax=Haliotis rufescens TaxID=6454 RepID=UPI00201E79DD|nr:uncharacterized protein LOC124146396 [Haliotis rufescens]
MSDILAGSGRIPLSVYKLPKNGIDFCLIRHFSELKTSPFSLALVISLMRLLSCCCSVSPQTHTSSVMPTTPVYAALPGRITEGLCIWFQDCASQCTSLSFSQLCKSVNIMTIRMLVKFVQSGQSVTHNMLNGSAKPFE